MTSIFFARASAEIQPLPQSYAAVVHAFLQKGDIETAVAVYAANRRTPVSSEKSWTALTTALFSTGRDNDRAVALLDLVINALIISLHAPNTRLLLFRNRR